MQRLKLMTFAVTYKLILLSLKLITVKLFNDYSSFTVNLEIVEVVSSRLPSPPGLCNPPPPKDNNTHTHTHTLTQQQLQQQKTTISSAGYGITHTRTVRVEQKQTQHELRLPGSYGQQYFIIKSPWMIVYTPTVCYFNLFETWIVCFSTVVEFSSNAYLSCTTIFKRFSTGGIFFFFLM